MPVLLIPADVSLAKKILRQIEGATYAAQLEFAHGPNQTDTIGIVVEDGFEHTEDLEARLKGAGLSVQVIVEAATIRPTVAGPETMQ